MSAILWILLLFFVSLSEDSLPIISQLKSLFLWLNGDSFGAHQTQIAFLKRFFIISQLLSFYHYLFFIIYKNENKRRIAMNIQLEFYHQTLFCMPVISQLISIWYSMKYNSTSAKKIQLKFFTHLTNFVTFPIRILFYYPFQSLFGRMPALSSIIEHQSNSSQTTEDMNALLIENNSRNISDFESVSENIPMEKFRTESWMNDNFREYPLSSLTLIGSHNAHSFSFHSAFSFVHNFAQCQSLSIYQQLRMGSRSLDIRLCNVKNAEIEIFCAHSTFLTVKLSDIILQTKRFLDEYPSEIVVFRCKTEWIWKTRKYNPVTKSDIYRVFKQCDALSYCAPIMDEYENILQMTIGELSEKKWNIIIFHEFVFNEYELQTSWNITRSYKPMKLMENCIQWMRDVSNEDEEKENKTWYLVNGQITPKYTLDYVLFMIWTGFRGLIIDSSYVNYLFMNMIDDELLMKVNVWDMDFIHPYVVQKIIKANKKYLPEWE